jgi:predicted nucleic acid-binding protein
MIADATGRVTSQQFAEDWPDFVRVPVTEALVERADRLAREYSLRGYDAIQLASALTWQEAAGDATVVATFDQQFWDAASRAGLTVWPERLPARR